MLQFTLMNTKHLLLSNFLFFIFLSGNAFSQKWIVHTDKGFRVSYTSTDNSNIKNYKKLIKNGVKSVKSFFHEPYKKEFSVFIYPNRHSLDSTWQKEWNMPDFKSECWMVASGVADKLDMISPKKWDKEACEHIYTDKIKTQRLITHELFHVYHGQLNVSPDFSDVTGIDWFVEGLATYASGQCDTSRIREIKKAIADKIVPMDLGKFWTGKLKYGLSGSVVMYIDHKYGRNKLKELLKYNKNTEILSSLNITESELLIGWKKFMEEL
ncbi:MAG: hypothetical protein JWN78_789 [Bacteroidota bacterium]|nr:hypothetical protein [Bacteroidota bacterium]